MIDFALDEQTIIQFLVRGYKWKSFTPLTIPIYFSLNEAYNTNRSNEYKPYMKIYS